MKDGTYGLFDGAIVSLGAGDEIPRHVFEEAWSSSPASHLVNAAPSRKDRPGGVWLITVIYGLSLAWTMLSMVLASGGAVPMNPALEAKWASLDGVDWFLTVAIGLVGLGGVVALFRLRRLAVPLLVVALILSWLLSAYQAMRTGWLGGIRTDLVGSVLGWGIQIAVIVYVRRLARNRVLS